MNNFNKIAVIGFALLATHGCTPQASTAQPIAETSSNLTFTEAEIKAFKCPVALPPYRDTLGATSNTVENPIISTQPLEWWVGSEAVWSITLNHGSDNEVSALIASKNQPAVEPQWVDAAIRNLKLRKLKQCKIVADNTRRWNLELQGDAENKQSGIISPTERDLNIYNPKHS